MENEFIYEYKYEYEYEMKELCAGKRTGILIFRMPCKWIPNNKKLVTRITRNNRNDKAGENADIYDVTTDASIVQ